MAWYLAALADNKDAGREAMAAVDVAVKIAFKVNFQYQLSSACLCRVLSVWAKIATRLVCN